MRTLRLMKGSIRGIRGLRSFLCPGFTLAFLEVGFRPSRYRMANSPRRQDLSSATPPSFIRITRHPDVLHDDEAVSERSWKVVGLRERRRGNHRRVG